VREVCPEFPGDPSTSHWSLPDPAGDDGSRAAFERCADELEERVDLLITRVLTSPGGSRHAR
jgi:protein-tyrosine-phosphatase